MPRSDTGKRDQGAALVMVLVLTITLGIVATALARYATVGLTYSSVVRDRADRLAAADGGMRYMIEKMRLRQTLCTTNAAQNGFTSVVPPSINGSTISVTCDRIGTPISDTQSWALIVTGNGVPANEPIFETQSGGNRAKSFGGPVFMSDPTRLELKADAEIKDGDLWYTGATCPVPAAPLNIDRLTFTPAFLRGPLCTTKRWDELFTAPTLPPAPDDVPPPTPIDMSSGCRVFFPGKYTPATTPQLSPGKNGQNYFVAGDYYFEDVDLQIQGTVIAGFSDGTTGDGQFLEAPACAGAASEFRGSGSGATFVLGGSSRITIDGFGALEIMRRRQGSNIVSVQAVGANPPSGYLPSTISADGSTNLFETKSGLNSDVAIHGTWWSPDGRVVFGNVTNTADGQFLGGLVAAYVEVQASASANALTIRVETSPSTAKWLLVSTATKNGYATRIRAVVQYQPDTAALAINSWRVA